MLARRRSSGLIEQKVTVVIAGIDTHKDTLAVAVVNDTGRLIAGGEVPNTERRFARLVDWLDTHQVLRVGIEGSGNFGRAVAVQAATLRPRVHHHASRRRPPRRQSRCSGRRVSSAGLADSGKSGCGRRKRGTTDC